MCIQFGNAKSPVFMRVRRTVPQFTFSLSARFVNSLSLVSTGFFRFFLVLFENRYIFLINSKKIPIFERRDFTVPSLQNGSYPFKKVSYLTVCSSDERHVDKE